MLKYKTNIMDDFLKDCVINKTELTLYLMNRVRIEGIVSSFDDNAIILNDYGHYAFINRNSIATIKYVEDHPIRDLCDETGMCTPDSVREIPLKESLRRWINKLLGW